MKRFIALAVIIPSLAAATMALTQSFSLLPGSTKGPVQPIAFPHDIHAGKLRMDCLYCHYGAEKSPVANLPPVGTCMGCHKMAVIDRPEVQKLAGYWERGAAIPWVEVYRLPDHVKFNHVRHVKAGVACQICHGPVEKMKVLVQVPSLKMGWCIQCHRARLHDSKYPTSMDCLICHH